MTIETQAVDWSALKATSNGRERPIIFSGDMVRAIIDGRKTMTRRVVKPQPPGPFDGDDWTPDYYGMLQPLKNGEPEEPSERDRWGVYGDYMEWGAFSPYGGPGDRLWVRERWRIGAWDEDAGKFAIDYADGPVRAWRTIPDDDDGEKFNALWIECCDELAQKGIAHDDEGKYQWKPGASPLRWRPSMFMPRWASRLTLEVVSVHVERLQDINEANAIAEGFERREHFIRKWDELNGKRGFGFDNNPWVWVIEFKKEAV